MAFCQSITIPTAGNGDINEVTAEVCRTNPLSGSMDEVDGVEAPCLFPFTLNGETYSQCIMDSSVLFRCPIRTVRGVGTNYTDTHLNGGAELDGAFCPTNRLIFA